MIKFYVKDSLSTEEVFDRIEYNPSSGVGKNSTMCCPSCSNEYSFEEFLSKYKICMSCLFKQNKDSL